LPIIFSLATVGEDLALHVVDHDVEVAIDPRGLLAAEVGESLLAADLLDVGDGPVDHGGGLGRGALGLVLGGGGKPIASSITLRERTECASLFSPFVEPLMTAASVSLHAVCSCALRHNSLPRRLHK
jgi:hypothetical protein